jgi:alkanesulfonate monooxygenase SsuD/methylene tetrahydromethanopterin reductase-like flavin-dependent oxidoreductase (luciferase family)
VKIGFHLPETERPVRWSELADLCRTAEDVGFDAIWVPDHLLYRFGDDEPTGPWECWSTLSAVAAVTSRVEIGPLVLCAGFREPALVAKMAATLDEISGGRLTLGLGVGWHEPEFAAFGFDYEHRFGRFHEAFTIIRTLLADGAIDFQGRYYTLRDCEIRPRGPRPGGLGRETAGRETAGRQIIPLMVGSRGDRTLRHTLPHVAAWNGWYAWVGNDPATYRTLRDQVDDRCREVGRDPAVVERSLSVLLQMPGGEGYPVDPRAAAIRGEPEQLAEALLAFAAEGLAAVQVVLEPNTAEAIERFGRAIEIVRRQEARP